jgi:hypothetical protein
VHGHVESIEKALELIRSEQVGPVVRFEGRFAARIAVLHEWGRKTCACGYPGGFKQRSEIHLAIPKSEKKVMEKKHTFVPVASTLSRLMKLPHR